jgi:hypothetical protein
VHAASPAFLDSGQRNGILLTLVPKRAMEGQGRKVKSVQYSQPGTSNQQEFLFVDASAAKTSRRNARSFVMQKARRERPWSTSKHATKQRTRGSSSPRSLGTPASVSTPNTASSSPTLETNRNGYFPDIDAAQQASTDALERAMCLNCGVFAVRRGQMLCPRCAMLKTAVSVREPDSGILDPFGASSIDITESVSELLDHCKSTSVRHRISLAR